MRRGLRLGGRGADNVADEPVTVEDLFGDPLDEVLPAPPPIPVQRKGEESSSAVRGLDRRISAQPRRQTKESVLADPLDYIPEDPDARHRHVSRAWILTAVGVLVAILVSALVYLWVSTRPADDPSAEPQSGVVLSSDGNIDCSSGVDAINAAAEALNSWSSAVPGTAEESAALASMKEKFGAAAKEFSSIAKESGNIKKAAAALAKDYQALAATASDPYGTQFNSTVADVKAQMGEFAQACSS